MTKREEIETHIINGGKSRSSAQNLIQDLLDEERATSEGMRQESESNAEVFIQITKDTNLSGLAEWTDGEIKLDEETLENYLDIPDIGPVKVGQWLVLYKNGSFKLYVDDKPPTAKRPRRKS